jgi:hypothetical protein
MTSGADRAVIDPVIMGSVVGDHLGPQEPGELTGDGGGHDRADILVDGELTEAAREADLGRPRAGDGGGRHPGVALADAGTDVGAVLIGPGGFAQLAAQMGITGPGDVTASLRVTRRVL